MGGLVLQSLFLPPPWLCWVVVGGTLCVYGYLRHGDKSGSVGIFPHLYLVAWQNAGLCLSFPSHTALPGLDWMGLYVS